MSPPFPRNLPIRKKKEKKERKEGLLQFGGVKVYMYIYTGRAAPQAPKQQHHGCIGNPTNNKSHTNYNNYINCFSSHFQTDRKNQPT
jgi:hypothetical protein